MTNASWVLGWYKTSFNKSPKQFGTYSSGLLFGLTENAVLVREVNSQIKVNSQILDRDFGYRLIYYGTDVPLIRTCASNDKSRKSNDNKSKKNI